MQREASARTREQANSEICQAAPTQQSHTTHGSKENWVLADSRAEKELVLGSSKIMENHTGRAILKYVYSYIYIHKYAQAHCQYYRAPKWKTGQPYDKQTEGAWLLTLWAIGCRLYILVCVVLWLLLNPAVKGLIFLTLTYFLHCVIHSLEVCTQTQFGQPERTGFSLPLIHFPATPWFFLNISGCILGLAHDPILSSLATSYCKLQTSKICVKSNDLQEITYVALWPTFSSFEKKKKRSWFLIVHSLPVRMFCWSKVSIKQHTCTGGETETPQYSVPALAFRNQLVEISKAPLIPKELQWFKLIQGSDPNFYTSKFGNAGVLLFPAEPACGNEVLLFMTDHCAGKKCPGLKCDLSIRGHQKVISDFIRYQPTQLPLRAHIAVTTYRSHSFPCVSQSLWAQGHQLEEKRSAAILN